MRSWIFLWMYRTALLHKFYEMNEGKRHHLHPHIVVCNVVVCVGGQQCIQFTPSSHLAHTEWIFFSSFHLIISPFLAINSDNWKRLCLHKSPPFIWGLISWQKTVFTCLLPIKRPHFHLTRISLILQTFFCNHTIWTAWAVFDEFTLPGMSDFGKHWWKHVVCRDKRGSLLSVEQPKWCRARAPLVVHTKIFFFHTCLPSILTHVLYHSHTGSLPPPINSIVFTVFRTHLTDYSKWKTDQKKDIFVPRRRRRHRTVDALHERHFCFFKARMKTESKCMWWT